MFFSYRNWRVFATLDRAVLLRVFWLAAAAASANRDGAGSAAGSKVPSDFSQRGRMQARARPFDALYGSRNHVELRASTNVALTDDVFVRLAWADNHQGGYENVYDFGCVHPSFTATP
jgi:hypothetical protein